MSAHERYEAALARLTELYYRADYSPEGEAAFEAQYAETCHLRMLADRESEGQPIMIRSTLNWYNDPMMKRLLEQERMQRTVAALNSLFEKGLVAFCPGGKVKLTPAMQKESWRLWV